MASMEHPIFSLSTKPDHHTRRYEHGSVFIEIAPSAHGLATVHDRDILIYCISQLMASLNDGKPLSSVVRFKAHDLLRATNRVTSGEGYAALKSALERLRGTQISTNIVTGGSETFEVFGLIERAKVVRETREGRMQEVEIKLSDWVFNAIQHQEVLTLHRDYFRLRKPLERRMYELARKHCGKKNEWKISLPLLQHKCGSCSTEKEFRRLVSNIVEEDGKFSHMPDYSVALDDSDMVIFRSRGSVASPELPFEQIPLRGLDPEVYNDARIVAPGWDVYHLEREWREWLTETPRNPEAAFIGFCKKRFERNGRP
ncbi:Replication initiator protein A [Caulifigura coniformis]|uniref:Replication initiator protein A n=2 Tax=Caulifigura coniformis TaxID=2527983 RepID=A0A517SA91_9PLAN|nr:Replication initiator protein A [Caulifigura coniformis]